MVPTPIGNLEDVTFRAVRVLREVPLVLAEDTRHTRKLLAHYGISARLESYHQHNKRSRLHVILDRLSLEDIALVSDAGMPAVSDPGFELIEAAVKAGVGIEVLPGPSALVTAVVAAALPAPGFVFLGFLSRSTGDRRRQLQQVARLPYALVLYEAPHRVITTLRDVLTVLGDRDAVAARELTKVHEEIVRSNVSGLLQRYEQQEPRGEFTLVLRGATETAEDRTAEILDVLRQRRLQGQRGRDAVSDIMARYGLDRNDAYRLWIETGQEIGVDDDSGTDG